MNPHLPTADAERRIADLLRRNEQLRQDLLDTRQRNSELERELAVARTNSQTDRASRRAALNLMEDAVNARRAEEREMVERARVEQELREADRRKDEFLATLAHELRNPLAPLRSGLALLRMSGSELSSEQICEMLERQVDHMVQLVDDLLEVSRITRGKLELRKGNLEIASVVATGIEMSRPLIEAAGHELTVDLPAEPLWIHADPLRIAQVLANLLNNAAKYTSGAGKIVLRVVRRDAELELSISDTGMGIAQDMLPRVFDVFTQVDHGHGGLGIGLTLVRSLVEAHGGAVEAESAGLGLGSTFVVRLPLLTNAPSRSTGPHGADEVRSNGHRPRVAVVDDNVDAANSLGMLLKLWKADVRVVHDGQAALDLLRTHRPSLMFLDIGMPDMDGYEVARRARDELQGTPLTLVALTGWGQDEDRQRCLDAGFDHHVVKPLSMTILKSLMGSLATADAPS